MDIPLDFSIVTEKYGSLRFAVLKISGLAKNLKLISSSENDRDFCVSVVHSYLIEPVISIKKLGLLSDDILEEIGRNFFAKSHMENMLNDVEIKEKGFFAVFRMSYKKLLVDQKMFSDKQRLFSLGTRSKMALEAMYPRNFYLLDELNRAKSMFADINRMQRTFVPQINIATNMLGAFNIQEKVMASAFKSIDRDLMKAIETNKSIFTAGLTTDFSQKSWFVKSLSSNLHEMMDLGDSMAKEIEGLIASSAMEEINRYRDIWKSVDIPSFVNASVEVVDDLIEEASEDNNVPAEDISWFESIREILIKHKDLLPVARNSAELGKLVVDFISIVHIVNNMWMQKIITPETGVLVIMHFYCAFTIFVCKLAESKD